MQKIFSSITAATGRQLKQSVKIFHSLMLYLLLPGQAGAEEEAAAQRSGRLPPHTRPGMKVHTYTHHRSHRCG